MCDPRWCTWARSRWPAPDAAPPAPGPPTDDPFFKDFFDQFFGRRGPGEAPGEFRTPGLGSGVIVDKRGYVITNFHVVRGADAVLIRLSSKEEFRGRVVGSDPKTDLAVVSFDPGQTELRVAPLGNSDTLRVGEWAIAIGNPFGLDQTVTVGVVSAVGRADVGIATYENFIQTDASINPGNSGGPLVNLRGDVIGINTAIVATGQGIGFAIPANMVKRVTAQLVDRGKVTRGWLGVATQPLTKELAESLGLREARGAVVARVHPGSPAAAAGAGDQRRDRRVRRGPRRGLSPSPAAVRGRRGGSDDRAGDRAQPPEAHGRDQDRGGAGRRGPPGPRRSGVARIEPGLRRATSAAGPAPDGRRPGPPATPRRAGWAGCPPAGSSPARTPGTVRATSTARSSAAVPSRVTTPASASTVTRYRRVSRMRGEGDLDPGGEGARGDDPPARVGGGHLGPAHGPLEHLDHRLALQPLGVDDQVVEVGIDDVDLVEVAHAAGLLAVVAAHEVDHRALVGLSPDCATTRRIHWRTRCSNGAMMRTRSTWGMPRRSHCPPRPMSTTLSASANSSKRRLEHGDVVAGLGVEPLEERRLGLVEVRQLLLGDPVPAHGVFQQLVVHVVIAEPLGQRHADLGAPRAHLMRDRYDRHELTSCDSAP